MSDTQTENVKVDRLAGPGVPGLESDFPVYHFDLSRDQFDSFQRDPVGFLRGIGLNADDGFAPHESISITQGSEVWTGSTWKQSHTTTTDELNMETICIVGADGWVHSHSHVVSPDL